jgi:hypothetical protein
VRCARRFFFFPFRCLLPLSAAAASRYHAAPTAVLREPIASEPSYKHISSYDAERIRRRHAALVLPV